MKPHSIRQSDDLPARRSSRNEVTPKYSSTASTGARSLGIPQSKWVDNFIGRHTSREASAVFLAVKGRVAVGYADEVLKRLPCRNIWIEAGAGPAFGVQFSKSRAKVDVGVAVLHAKVELAGAA